MAINQEKYIQSNIAMGVCDERGGALHATASRLPNGEFGMVVLGLKGNILSIFDCDMKGVVDDKALYSIPMKEVSNLKINDNFFAELIKGYTIRFTYNGFTWIFRNASMRKHALNVIRSEANQK